MDSIKYSPIYNEPERSTAFRLGTGNGFTIDLKVKLVTVVLCWVYVIIQRKNMSSIFCPKQAVLAIEIFERRILSKCLRMVIFYKISI